MYRTAFIASAFLTALLLSACGGGEPGQPAPEPGPTLTLEENLVIGNEGEDSGNPSLLFVNELAVDPEGAVYVYDGSDGVSSIYKYDRQGRYLRTLGGEGEGPGEHRQVTSMFTDSENRLITADFQNARITIFGEGGEVIRNEPTPGINSVVQIREMSGGRYLLTGWNEESAGMIHLVSRDFSGIQESMGDVSRLSPWYDREAERRWLTRRAGFAAMAGEQSLFYVPAYYDGTIYRFSPEDGEWVPDGTAEGYRSIDSPVSFHPQSDPPPRVDGMQMLDGEVTMIMRRTVSFGIYPLEDDTYLHLSYLFPANAGSADNGEEEQEGAELVMERFSASMELLQYTVTDTLDLGVTLRKRPLWVDRGGQLYLADNSGDSLSVVRRYQIEGLAEN